MTDSQGTCKSSDCVAIKMKELPASLFVLENLQYLHLARNHITKIPDEIGRLKRLRVLDLSANMLQTLPSAIGGCRDLRELIIMHNQLREIPKELGECRRLKVLDVRYNVNIKYLPYSLLTRGRHLRVDTDGCSMIHEVGELTALCRNLNSSAPCPRLQQLCTLGMRPRSNRCDGCLSKCTSPLRLKGVMANGLPLVMHACANCDKE